VAWPVTASAAAARQRRSGFAQIALSMKLEQARGASRRFEIAGRVDYKKGWG